MHIHPSLLHIARSTIHVDISIGLVTKKTLAIETEIATCSLLHHYLPSCLLSIYQLQFAAIATQSKNAISLRTFELQAPGMASDDFRKFGRDALPEQIHDSSVAAS